MEALVVRLTPARVEEELPCRDLSQRLSTTSLKGKAPFNVGRLVQFGPERFPETGPSPVALAAIKFNIEPITHLVHVNAIGQVLIH